MQSVEQLELSDLVLVSILITAVMVGVAYFYLLQQAVY